MAERMVETSIQEVQSHEAVKVNTVTSGKPLL